MPIELGSFSIGVIAGGIIIGFANHFLSKSRNREDRTIAEFNKAATTFRNAFIVQFNFLKYNVNSGSGDTSNVGEYLRTHYVSTHLKAFETFKCCLSARKIKAIDKKWTKYCNFNQYSKNKELALKNLEDVLKFANHKR